MEDPINHFSDTINCVFGLAEEEAGRCFTELMHTSVLLESLHLQKSLACPGESALQNCFIMHEYL